MAGLAYGAYGYSVINANGETDCLVTCSLRGNANTPIGYVTFTNVVTDPLSMAVPGASQTWPCIRTPVAGIYDIESCIWFAGGASTGTGQVSIWVDKQGVLTSGGSIQASGSGMGYIIAQQATFISNAVNTSATASAKGVFLEKDCYITINTTGGGTPPTLLVTTDNYLTVSLRAADNGDKTIIQVW